MSRGATTLISISGASQHQISAEVGHFIYGGMAGDTGACASVSEVCNTCTGNGLEPCNFRSIHPNLLLRISAQTNDSTLFNNTTNAIDVVLKVDERSISAANIVRPDGSGNFSIDVPWSSVCSQISSGGGGCNSDMEATLVLGLAKNGEVISAEKVSIKLVLSVIPSGDPRQFQSRCDESGSGTLGNHEGFCFMQSFAGDGKLYIDGADGNGLLRTPSGFPAAGAVSSLKWKKIVIFYGEKPVNSITNADAAKEIEFDNTVADPLIDGRVDGLENGLQYCMIMANQDVTGNISRFTNLSEYATDATSLLCGTPSPVVGLLDDKRCFIATAAFGSPLDPHVETLRSFRDRFLRGTSWGRELIDFYYGWSPVWARQIERDPVFKEIVRVALWPVVGWASLTLTYGLWLGLLPWALFSGAFFGAFRFFSHRRARRQRGQRGF